MYGARRWWGGWSLAEISRRAKPGPRYLPAARALGASVVIGDATSTEVLRRAGLTRARALAALTSIDAVNLEVALVARGLHPGDLPLAVRVYDKDMADRSAAAFGLRGVMSVSAEAAPHVVRTAG